MSHPATPAYGRRAGVPRQSFGLTETYSDKEFLRKLAALKETPSVNHWQIDNADKIFRSLKIGYDLQVTYEQREYALGDGVNARLGRNWNFPANKHVVSAQNLGRDIKRLTMQGNYVEIDMVNAHPTFLLAKYPDSPMLIRYIRDRKSMLE
jgi:hypothetical protein